MTLRGQLTEELRDRIMAAEAMAILEDIYLPYRPKRRTRAFVAEERGLEPLARMIFAQDISDPVAEAKKFVDNSKEIESIDDALAGARDIMADLINEDVSTRSKIRNLFETQGILRSMETGDKKTEGAKYKDYFDWSERLYAVPSHRLMAMMRAQREGFLSLHVVPTEDEENAMTIVESNFVRGNRGFESTGQAGRQRQLQAFAGPIYGDGGKSPSP